MQFASLTRFLRKHFILTAAFAVAVVSTVFIRPTFQELVVSLDFRVLGLLFSLMAVIKGFSAASLMDAAAIYLLRRCRSLIVLYFVLAALVFVFAMIVTNDVALLTFVPLTLIVCRYLKVDSVRIVVVETIAANLGSALTPMGNPQNLFLYSYYRPGAGGFFSTMLPLAIPSLILLGISAKLAAGRDSRKGVYFECFPEVPSVKWSQTAVLSVALVMILAAVFHGIDYRWAVAGAITAVTLCDIRLWKKIDYSLLLVFLFFFVFTGNLSKIELLQATLPRILIHPSAAYFSAFGISQVISNVPAALLLAPFTESGRPVFAGVNIGGLGTLVASLASVISYQFYVGEGYSSPLRYLFIFTVYNIAFLIILLPFGLLLIQM